MLVNDKAAILKQLLFLFLVLFILFTPNKLSGKVRIIGIIAVFILGVIVFFPTGYSKNYFSRAKSLHDYQPKTQLSKKATHLHMGMNKAQVVKLLGKPTWAEHVKGVPLAFVWKNGNCNPVFVTFNRHLKVNGMDEGRAECLDHLYKTAPDNKFLCTQHDVERYCA